MTDMDNISWAWWCSAAYNGDSMWTLLYIRLWPRYSRAGTVYTGKEHEMKDSVYCSGMFRLSLMGIDPDNVMDLKGTGAVGRSSSIQIQILHPSACLTRNRGEAASAVLEIAHPECKVFGHIRRLIHEQSGDSVRQNS